MNTTQSTSFSILFDYVQFPLRDPDWKRKLGIGMLVGLAGLIIPVIPWIFIAGYAMRIAEEVINQGDQPRLPEWTDYGGLFKDGLRIAAAMATLVLPLILFMFLGYGVIFGSVFGATSSDSNDLSLLAILSIVLGSCLVLLVFVMAIATGLAMPAALSHVTAKRSYRAVFAVKEWSAIWRANMGGFLVSYLMLIVVGFVLGLAMNILVLTICLAPFAIGAVLALTSILNAALGAREYRIGRQRVWDKLGISAAPAAPLPPRPEATAERTAVKLPAEPAPAKPAVPAVPAAPAFSAAEPEADASIGMQTVVSYDRDALLGELKEKTEKTEPGLAEAGAAAAAATMATVMARREDVLKEVLPQAEPVEVAPEAAEPPQEVKTEEIVLPAAAEIVAPAQEEKTEEIILPVAAELVEAVHEEKTEDIVMPPVTEEEPKPAKKRKPKTVKKSDEEETPPPVLEAAPPPAVAQEPVVLPPAPGEPGEMGTMIMDRAALLSTPPAAEAQGEPPGQQENPPQPPELAEPTPIEEAEGGATMIYDRDTLAGLLKKTDADETAKDEADSDKDEDA